MRGICVNIIILSVLCVSLLGCSSWPLYRPKPKWLLAEIRLGTVKIGYDEESLATQNWVRTASQEGDSELYEIIEKCNMMIISVAKTDEHVNLEQLLKEAARLPNLRSLGIDNLDRSLTLEEYHAIFDCKYINHICISNSRGISDHLDDMSLQTLGHLELGNPDSSDLQSMANMDLSLQELDLIFKDSAGISDVDDKDLEAIIRSNLTGSLRIADFRENGARGQCLAGVSHADKLHTLAIRFQNLEPGAIAHLSECDNIRSLALLGRNITFDRLNELHRPLMVDVLYLTGVDNTGVEEFDFSNVCKCFCIAPISQELFNALTSQHYQYDRPFYTASGESAPPNVRSHVFDTVLYQWTEAGFRTR